MSASRWTSIIDILEQQGESNSAPESPKQARQPIASSGKIFDLSDEAFAVRQIIKTHSTQHTVSHEDCCEHLEALTHDQDVLKRFLTSANPQRTAFALRRHFREDPNATSTQKQQATLLHLISLPSTRQIQNGTFDEDSIKDVELALRDPDIPQTLLEKTDSKLCQMLDSDLGELDKDNSTTLYLCQKLTFIPSLSKKLRARCAISALEAKYYPDAECFAFGATLFQSPEVQGTLPQDYKERLSTIGKCCLSHINSIKNDPASPAKASALNFCNTTSQWLDNLGERGQPIDKTLKVRLELLRIQLQPEMPDNTCAIGLLKEDYPKECAEAIKDNFAPEGFFEQANQTQGWMGKLKEIAQIVCPSLRDETPNLSMG